MRPERRRPPGRGSGHLSRAFPCAPLAQSRVPAALGLALTLILALTGCRRAGGPDDPVDVLYAGSLTAIMEEDLGPAFTALTGRGFRGEGRGSVAAAHQIREGVRRPDLYITADTTTLSALGEAAPGWAVAFARGELVIGYAGDGRRAAALDSAAAGAVPWYRVVTRPGFRLGRTDPELDPKGYRTLWMFELAERHYRRTGLAERLAAVAGPDRVFPEENLAVRVQTGQLDAAAFYLAEARAHGLEAIRLPPEINLGDPDMAELYGSLTFRDRSGRSFRGSPILYAATLPAASPDTTAGLEFLRFLLGDRARSILSEHGFPPELRVLRDPGRAPLSVRTRKADRPRSSTG